MVKSSYSAPSSFTLGKSSTSSTTTTTSGGGGGSSGGGTGGFFGTYNPSTGTYTSPEGNQQSMAVAPPGAVIVGGSSPLVRTYQGGGGGGTTTTTTLTKGGGGGGFSVEEINVGVGGETKVGEEFYTTSSKNLREGVWRKVGKITYGPGGSSEGAFMETSLRGAEYAKITFPEKEVLITPRNISFAPTSRITTQELAPSPLRSELTLQKKTGVLTEIFSGLFGGGKKVADYSSDEQYNQMIRKLYKQNLKSSGVKVEYGIGDLTPGFSLMDIDFGGAYFPSEKKVYVNILGAGLNYVFSLGKKNVIEHEFGHYLDVKSGLSKLGTDPFKQISGFTGGYGYPKEQIDAEQIARSFDIFVSEPSKVRAENPYVAKVFENALGYDFANVRQSYGMGGTQVYSQKGMLSGGFGEGVFNPSKIIMNVFGSGKKEEKSFGISSPSMVSVVPLGFGGRGMSIGETMNFGEKIKYSFSGAFKILQGEGKIKTTEMGMLSPWIGPERSNFLSPFQVFLTQQKGDVPVTIPWRGTQFDGGYNPPGEYGTKTGFEREKALRLAQPSLFEPIEVKAGKISSKLSKDIVAEFGQENLFTSTGEVKPEIQSLFQERYGSEINKWKGYQPEGSELSKFTFNVPKMMEVGGMVGLTLISPVTGFAVGAIKGAETSYLGFGEAILGKDLTVKERLIAGGKGVIGFGGFAFGVGKSQLFWAKGIDKELLEELQGQKFNIRGAQIAKTSEGEFILAKYGRNIPGLAEENIGLRMPVFKTGEGLYSITGGKGKNILKYYSEVKQGWITGENLFQFGGRGQIGTTAFLGNKQLKLDLGLMSEEKITGGVGTGWYRKSGEDLFNQFKFTGLVGEQQGYYGVTTGNVNKLGLNLVTGERKVFGKVTGFGMIKKLPEEATQYLGSNEGISVFSTELPKEETLKGITMFMGGGAKSSPQFLQSLYSEKLAFGTGLGVKTAGVSSKQLTSQFISGGGKGVTSGLGFGSLTGLSIKNKEINSLKLPSVYQQKLSQVQIQNPASRFSLLSVVIPVQGSRNIQRQFVSPALAQPQIQQPKQVMKQMFGEQGIGVKIPSQSFDWNWRVPPPPIWLPGGELKFGKKKAVKGKRKYKYTPGLAALGLRGTPYAKFFTSQKMPSTYWTGLTTRTIVTGRKTKRRKHR